MSSSLSEINNLIFQLEEILKDRNLERDDRKRFFKELSSLSNLKQDLLNPILSGSTGLSGLSIIEPSDDFSIEEIDGVPSITFGSGKNKKNKKVKYLGNGIIGDAFDYVKSSFSPNNDYTNNTKAMLKKYGNLPIVGLQIRRTPILKILDSVINIISLGKFDKLKKDYGFDKLFHLYIVFRVKLLNGKDKEIVVEKNQSINVSDDIPTKTKDTEILNIAWGGRGDASKKTINDLLNNTLATVGKNRFFVYNPWNANPNSGNCQRFVLDVLSSNNLLGDYYKNFILQDITELVKKMPSYSKSIATGITDLAAGTEKLLGMGNDNMVLHAVIVKKPVELKEVERIQKEFTNKKFIRETPVSYRIRVIPKTKFIKKSYRTKIINKNPHVSLIFGKLK